MADNFDPQELHTFNAAAADWWNLEGEFKTLHAINPTRLQFIEQHTQLQGKTVLDVGCGGGILTEALAQAGAQVTGIDMAESALKIARQHAQSQNLQIDYQQITVEELAETSTKKFAFITCMELLEHVPDPQSVVRACANLVEPEGYVFFSTLNRSLKSYLFAVIGAEYVLKLLPKGVHNYERFIRPAELAGWARVANLDVVQISGLNYNPWSHNARLSTDPEINYLLACRKTLC